MPRRKRLKDAGLLRHVISRGNSRMRIFLDRRDYQQFFFILRNVVEAYDVECWEFCAMPNHFHLALLNRKPNLSDAMRDLKGEYAIWWNIRHAHAGHVFGGRFKDQIVEERAYLRALVRYIALNPVRANLVKRPEEWEWSSYRCTAGLCAASSLLSPERVLRDFCEGDETTARERYICHVMATSRDAEFEAFRSRARVIGSREFKRSVIAPPEEPVQPRRTLEPVTRGFI